MATEKRLIDANELLEKHTCDVYGAYDDSCMVQAVFVPYIKGAPTVDAVEVVHGRWIAVPSSDMMTGKAYKCSECGKMRSGSWMPNYCQNCGAKMDGGADNGL